MGSTGRFLLLLFFVVTGLFLASRYIVIPLIYLFRLKQGISNKQASVLIGRHFPEVDDKLYNLLELAEDRDQTELLLASIEQKSAQLKTVPFKHAINLRENLKYARYLIIPIVVVGIIALSGNFNSFFGSYDRVVNYQTAYEPPAPFSFKVLAGKTRVLESEEYTVQVSTEGEIRPENVFIVVNGREFLLQLQDGLYQYTFTPPLQSSEFFFRADEVRSKPYFLEALKAPVIEDFKLHLKYPGYTGKVAEVLKGTGNATLPEGTEVRWEIKGKHTENIQWSTKDTAFFFEKQEDAFEFKRRIYSNTDYQLATSNIHVDKYETMDYEFKVVRDAYPSIRVNQVLDSLNPNLSYYVGEASDDYKVSHIDLVYYPMDDEKSLQRLRLRKPDANFDQFYYTFPSGLLLEEGKEYAFYFEATDNDAIHGGKKVKSRVFNRGILDDNQLKDKQLEFQQSILNNFDRSLEDLKEQKEVLKEINKEQKEKNSLSFNDQNQVKDFLQKQQQQEEMMEKFSEQLKENLEKGNPDDEMNKLLRERLERRELEAQKNAKLLEELKEISDKIEKEELSKRLEELAKKQQNSERSLEQLLELTKRYYVTEKASQLAEELRKLAEKQEALSEEGKEKEAESKEQSGLNEDFKKLAEELRELEKDNKDLKKPLSLNIDEDKEEDVKTDQKEALEELNKQEEGEQSPESQSGDSNSPANKANQKQKSAAQKMKEMSESLSQSSMAGRGSTITEDAEMLRQILDNLVIFSLKQEKLYESLEGIDLDVSNFSNTVREQQRLRDLFEHVDDSLFALSLRRAELSEFVNEQITEVYYNIDKSVGSITENQIYQGIAYQQYVLNASNSLADFLASLLDNMQQSLSQGSGSGGGQDGFQLPDIIKAQGELQQKMGQSGQSGKEGSEGQEGEGQQEGSGKEGESGEGKQGQEGQQPGEDGEGGKEGKGKGQGQEEGSGGGQGELGEEELREIYDIYKEQQRIRQELEKQLEDMIRQGDRDLARKLIRQMEAFENELLERGITQRTISKMNTIRHQLLKLENAALKQGNRQERESKVNEEFYRNPVLTKPELLEKYKQEIEILNRQALPLQQIFQNKVKDYFRKDD
ncbi:DUF4175 family protein [Poritiphilus flavus]|nr:DUF4175 family protein [Poritiphilus flavus]